MPGIVFLDWDGVANHFSWDAAGHAGPFGRPECIAELNRIAAEPGVRFVVASSWRGLVHSGDMTLAGLRVLFRSHGFRGDIIGVTPAGPLVERGEQIRRWIREERTAARMTNEPFVAIDDMDFGHTAWGVPLVQTDGRQGITRQDADRVIAKLKGATT